MGEKEGSCLWGLARFVLERPAGLYSPFPLSGEDELLKAGLLTSVLGPLC